MCRTAYYAHPLCGCRWYAVTHPCGPGMGFRTCSRFFTGIAQKDDVGFGTGALQFSWKELFVGRNYDKERRVEETWSTVPCPLHTLGGVYDRNYVRRILDSKNGMRVGLGPDPQDLGLECGCIVM
ncbi:hypothetical protein Sste5346_001547 [Sporothrix stenoceras]|uniref:Uncharacterized protein n=1 Tax=Sporothrix stenoceras TaxID=5173 RepID=A0ABR3ZNU9_9PEZI